LNFEKLSNVLKILIYIKNQMSKVNCAKVLSAGLLTSFRKG